jgi:hypothetical protein
VAHIAEAYFHLKPFEVSGENLQRLGRQLSAIAAQAASGLFRPDSEIEVRLERGSLKGWAVVIGGFGAFLHVAYHDIADYKHFKEGIIEFVHDGQKYSKLVINNFLQTNQVPPRQVYRTERRTRTPGRLVRLLERREWFESHRRQLGPEAIKRETDTIEAQTKKVLEDLDPEEQRVVRKLLEGETIESETMDLSDQTPEPVPAHDEEPVAIAEDYSQPELFEMEIATTGETKSKFYDRFRLSEWPRRQVAPH